MSKESIISKLVSQGMSKQEAIQEFNDKVNYYLRGTNRTQEDLNYAIKCAIEDFESDDIEYVDIDMLDLQYN